MVSSFEDNFQLLILLWVILLLEKQSGPVIIMFVLVARNASIPHNKIQ